MERYILLLRGINVGGKNVLPMKGLTGLCESLGAQNVRTYIQSGNVALDASATLAATLADDLQARITQNFGLTVPVVLRSAAEMAAMLARNPWPNHDLALVSVAFLREQPTAAQVASLDPQRSPPDEFVVDGREVFLYTPDGFARTKLTNAWLDGKLKTVSTVRNWRTVAVLATL